MPQHDDQPGTELFGGKLDAADLRGGNDVAGHSDDEQVAEPLIENDLDRYSRIRTAKDGRERFLAGRQLDAAGTAGQGVVASDIGDETAISVAQQLEPFQSRDHR